MTISNRHIQAVITTATLGLSPWALADVVELNHGDSLTGKINALDENTVTLTSPLSVTPLQIKADKIKNILFEPQSKANKIHREQITLSNGDTLPCKVLKMDQQNLTISTWFSGEFTIPRNQLTSLQFGISDTRTVYHGNDAPSEWSTKEGLWTLTKRGYTCEGNGTLARSLELPENLNIHFDLSWNNSPNFVFRFCAKNDKATTTSNQDAYELSYNSFGLQIRRFMGSRKATPLASIHLPPHEIEDNKLGIDLRINRKLGKVTLLLNGIERGTYVDSFHTAQGNFIILNNRSSHRDSLYVGNLQISEWTDDSQPRHQEKLPQEKTDILIDSEGEKRTGKITVISPATSNKRTIQMEVPYSDKPLRVPDHRISALIFAKQNAPSTPPASHYTLELIGGGSLQLKSPRLHNGKITTQHHILGACTIDTSAVSRIYQNSSSK